jgi:5-methylcytosine-specific restriction endonuclease McrA
MRVCTAPGCSKQARSSKAEYCPMHYHRLYRHGSLDAVASSAGVRTGKGRRYRVTHDPSHPLAMRNGFVYVHRKVLYDTIGPGEHACHWCGTIVRWAPKGTRGILVPDHLNGYGNDNRPENLVPSCMGCNTARGQQERSRALREAGFWSGVDTIAHLKSRGRRAQVEPVTQEAS